MRRSSGGSRNGNGLELAYPPHRASAPRMREDLRAYLSERSLDHRVICDVVLATEEALINAIVHAGDVGGTILVSAHVHDGEASVEVRDLGCGFDAGELDVDRTPDVDRCHGRGLFLIHTVMDEVQVKSGRLGTTVRMVRRTA